MKRYLSRLLPLALLALPLLSMQAGGPKWMKAATKAQLTLHCIQPQGDTLHANAFFLDEAGSLTAPFKAIQHARQAWVTDASGNRYAVSRIEGFSSTYDIVRLKADMGKRKATALPSCTEPPTVGSTLYLMPRGEADEVTKVEKAGEHNYYTLKSTANTDLAGMPLIDAGGAVAAIVQTPVVTPQSPNYALDIRFVLSLGIRPIDANHTDLRHCLIPKRLPADEAQATSFLYIAGTMQSELMNTYVEDFIRAFPKSVTGYIQKAELRASEGDLQGAEAALQEGLNQETGHNDELYYARSRMAYNAALAGQDSTQATTPALERALADIAEAHRLSPQPLYVLHEANVLFAQKRYEEAYAKYMAVTQTKMRSAETFMYAWQCQRYLGSDDEAALLGELLALNDSAVACFCKPYGTEAAPYLLLRSNTLAEAGRLREAISGLNDYEHLMQGRLNAQFYYQREQLEGRTRMYGPAVNDMHTAISLAPDEPVYHAELASLLFRLNDLDSAQAECHKAIALDATFPDAHRLLGICLREKGDKAGARAQLQKAADLGDELARGILEKME